MASQFGDCSGRGMTVYQSRSRCSGSNTNQRSMSHRSQFSSCLGRRRRQRRRRHKNGIQRRSCRLNVFFLLENHFKKPDHLKPNPLAKLNIVEQNWTESSEMVLQVTWLLGFQSHSRSRNVRKSVESLSRSQRNEALNHFQSLSSSSFFKFDNRFHLVA